MVVRYICRIRSGFFASDDDQAKAHLPEAFYDGIGDNAGGNIFDLQVDHPIDAEARLTHGVKIIIAGMREIRQRIGQARLAVYGSAPSDLMERVGMKVGDEGMAAGGEDAVKFAQGG